MRNYSRLSIDEREEISRLLALNCSLREIARRLDRQPSTVSREVRRSKSPREYRAVSAHKKATRNQSSRRLNKRKLLENRRLWSIVRSKLKMQWSPQQIAAFLKKRYKSSLMQISAETIYDYIYVFLRRGIREEFTHELRQAHKKRRKRGRSAKGQVSNLEDMTLIDERPKEVDDRLLPGHWEGDLMIGGARVQSALGTLIERTTRFAILVPLKNKTSEEVRKQFARELKKLPKELRLSLTYDQGREMAQHKRLSKETNMKVYFAHPQSPWERGTNENTNGLVRQYFPKGTDFTKVTRAEIKKAQRLLNTRPRKTLGWKTPQEAMRELLQ
jgi:transposase, IS30 family